MTPENIESCVHCLRKRGVSFGPGPSQRARQAGPPPESYGSPPVVPGGADYDPSPKPLAQQPPLAVPADQPGFQGESLIGVIQAASMGGSSFDLVVTTHRVIGFYVGFSGGGSSLTGAALGAVMSSGESGRRASYAGLTFDAVAQAHTKNFWIPSVSITSASLDGGISALTLPTLKVVAGGRRFHFSFEKQNWSRNEAALAQAKAILWSALGPRAVFVRV